MHSNTEGKPEALDSSTAETLTVSLKRPLAEGIEALGDKNFTRAKREFGEFQEFWNKVEPAFKEKAPDAYQQIDKELTQVKASLTETSSPNQDKAIAAFQALNQTIEANASKVVSGQSVASKPAQQSTTTANLSLLTLVSMKRPMAEGIEALNDGNFTRAKREYDEFLGLWKQSEEAVKKKSPQVFDEVEVGMDSVYAALIEPKNPNKAKAIAAFTQMQTTLNKL
ncbi:hypothetical protein OGM63_21940 [Plectonema radiosum NIES-515]|uniref:Uncharacterized protein n=1 Tax=Plectonema radiosum NIES-515 TaxID=2986073 RepID=A0ABT3B443_9CYAN|nr:hypothetical protein [Plectonema radiosum]MCV3216138.1 hypothetical protein [Plectonema radiosum NIES-515]